MSEAQDKKNKTKKVLVIVIIIIVFLVSTSLIAYFIATSVLSDDNNDDNSEDEINEIVQTGVFVKVGQYLTNLEDDNVIRLSIELEVENNETKEEVEERKAKIHDRILSIIRTKTSEEIKSDGIDELRKDIASELNNILNEGIVLRVYFTDIFVQ